MIRNLAPKPALVVIGSTTLAVVGFATLTRIYVSVQNARTTAYSVRPAAFQQFDSSTENASAATGVDSPEAANAAMAQSGDGFAPQQASPNGQSRTVESFDAETSAAGQARQYGRAQQYGQPQQYGQSPQYAQAAYGAGSAT